MSRMDDQGRVKGAGSGGEMVPGARMLAAQGGGREEQDLLDLAMDGGVDGITFHQRLMTWVVGRAEVVAAGYWAVREFPEKQARGFRLEGFGAAGAGLEGAGVRAPGMGNGLLELFGEVIRQQAVVVVPAGYRASGEVVNGTVFLWAVSPVWFRDRFLGVGLLMLRSGAAPESAGRVSVVWEAVARYLRVRMVTSERMLEDGGRGWLRRERDFLSGLLRVNRSAGVVVYAANGFRDLFGVDRVGVFGLRDGGWELLGVSGAERFEPLSQVCVAMRKVFSAFAGESKTMFRVPSLGRVPEGTPAVQRDALEELAALVPEAERHGVFGCVPRGMSPGGVNSKSGDAVSVGADTPIGYGVLMEGAGGVDGMDEGAQAVLLRLTKEVGERLAELRWQEGRWFGGLFGGGADRLGGERTPFFRRHWLTTLLVVLFFAGWIPVEEGTEGECVVMPSVRRAAVVETEGRLREILVREGEVVESGQVLARVDVSALETAREEARQTRLRLEAEARSAQAAGDSAAYRSASLEAGRLTKREALLTEQIGRAEVRAPVRGVVLTKDLAQREGEVLAVGALLCEVASLEGWELDIQIPEADFELVYRGLSEGRALPVGFVLEARSGLVLKTRLERLQQVSQMAYAQAGGSVFFVTANRFDVPEELAGRLRPGFSGRARIETGRTWFGIKATRKFVHYLRMRWVF